MIGRSIPKVFLIAVLISLSLAAFPAVITGGAPPGQGDAAKTGGSLYPAYCGYSGQINSWAADIFDTQYYVNVPAGTSRLSAGVTSNDIGWRVSMSYGVRSSAFGIQSSAYVDNPRAGYWYIRVYASYGNRSGTFWITCGSGSGGGSGSAWTGGACTTVGEAHDNCAQGMGVTYGRCYTASIGWAGDNDCYRFYFSGGILNAYSLGSIDTYAYLYDVNNTLLTYNDDSGQSLNFHISRSCSPGYYCLRVRHYSSSGTGNYTIYLGGTGSGASAGTGSTGSSCSTARSSARWIGNNSGSIGSNISGPGQWNWFRIEITGYVGGTLTVYTNYAVGSNLDVYGYLYDSNCSYLTSDDDSGTGYNFRFSRYVSPGVYYVGVRAYSSTATGWFYLYTNFQQRQ